MPPLSDLGVAGSGLGVIPVMLVNPSMENVILVLDDGGTWHPQLHAVWVGMGMVPPGPGLRAYKPIAGAAARLTAAAVTITLRRPARLTLMSAGLLRPMACSQRDRQPGRHYARRHLCC